MAKSLDFTKVKKNHMNVTLPDGTNVKVLTPTKKIMNEFVALSKSMETELDENVLDDLYEVAAKIMSHNKEGITVTDDMLGEVLDYDDIMTFIELYTEFINEKIAEKN